MEVLLANPVLLFMAALRPLGIFIIFPLLSARSLGSALLRNAIIIIAIIPVLPLYIVPNSPLLPAHFSLSVGYIFQELLIGMIIGFVAAIPFWALDSAGFLIDTVRGSSMSTVLNPGLGDASSVLGVFFVQIFITLFMLQGGFNHMLSAFYHSYLLLPPDMPLSFDKRWLNLLLEQWNLLGELCISFSLPSLVIMVLVDMALGLLNRSAQQLNVFFLAMPIKSAMVLLMLIIGLFFALKIYFQHMDTFDNKINRLFEVM